MIALIQRVLRAAVVVEGLEIGAIGAGVLALVCAERADSGREGAQLLDKLLNYRIFADEAGRMNRSLRDTAGGLLIVPQFTLAADTRTGTRPSFTPAAAPEVARTLFDEFLAAARAAHETVAAGRFGAHMEVSLTNDGPVTFWLQVGAAGASHGH